jgi:hypothetical protein
MSFIYSIHNVCEKKKNEVLNTNVSLNASQFLANQAIHFRRYLILKHFYSFLSNDVFKQLNFFSKVSKNIHAIT